MGFELPELGYDYDSLEPHIDAETMELHHSKHHAGYTAKLNAAIEGTDMESMSIEELLVGHFDNAAVRNNGGGFWNHRMFWETMSPSGGGDPTGDLANAISDAFGSFESMKAQLKDSAMTRFGSGWAWLCVGGDSLCICSTPNQDNPLMLGEGIPYLDWMSGSTLTTRATDPAEVTISMHGGMLSTGLSYLTTTMLQYSPIALMVTVPL